MLQGKKNSKQCAYKLYRAELKGFCGFSIISDFLDPKIRKFQKQRSPWLLVRFLKFWKILKVLRISEISFFLYWILVFLCPRTNVSKLIAFRKNFEISRAKISETSRANQKILEEYQIKMYNWDQFFFISQFYQRKSLNSSCEILENSVRADYLSGFGLR